jgi:hypothetical protein
MILLSREEPVMVEIRVIELLTRGVVKEHSCINAVAGLGDNESSKRVWTNPRLPRMENQHVKVTVSKPLDVQVPSLDDAGLKPLLDKLRELGLLQ